MLGIRKYSTCKGAADTLCILNVPISLKGWKNRVCYGKYLMTIVIYISEMIQFDSKVFQGSAAQISWKWTEKLQRKYFQHHFARGGPSIMYIFLCLNFHHCPVWAVKPGFFCTRNHLSSDRTLPPCVLEGAILIWEKKSKFFSLQSGGLLSTT